MIYPSRRLCRQSISSQIRGNNGEPLGESRGNFAPHNVRLRSAVKEEKRRPIPTNDSVNRGAKAVNRMGSESRKEGCRLAPNRIELTLRKISTARAYSEFNAQLTQALLLGRPARMINEGKLEYCR